MKILHALVGYLAVTTLPIHPFAFASPLATIDYDGYVNNTHQTVTTENHSDGALMKRAPGDIIDARQEELLPEVAIIVAIVASVVLSIVWIKDDGPKRAAFTRNSISNSLSKYPKYNWVICHSPYTVEFAGAQGTDWGHTHHELAISFGRTIGYDLYWARSGTFYRYGDGGFVNWAYNGNILGTDNGGATVYFGAIL